MAFTINNYLIFIDRMQYMNSSLDVLVENFTDNDFKYLSQEFTSGMLELVKQKGVYPYDTLLNTMTVLKSFLIKNYLIDVNFIIL